MPRWQNEPPKPDRECAYRIVRTPAAGLLQAIVTSEAPIGCCTHFVNHRTTPCEGPETCPACEEGFSYRWHGWTGAMLSISLEHVLFEFTATTSDVFKNYLAHHDTLRGCHFKCWRPSKRPNGRVVIQTVPADLAKWKLPDPPNLKRILCHIWGVPFTDLENREPQVARIHQIGLAPRDGDGRNRPPKQP
jgi:hypothetical protein